MTTYSFSRLGSANAYDGALRNINTRQSALVNLQDQISSGKRVLRASDDPLAAAQAERALTRLSRIATDQRALESQRSAIISAESTLGDVTDALQKFRQLVVNGGSGTLNPSDRHIISNELQGLRDHIYSLATRTDSNGLPLLAHWGAHWHRLLGLNPPHRTTPTTACLACRLPVKLRFRSHLMVTAPLCSTPHATRPMTSRSGPQPRCC
ncbi:MAG: flagellin [Rhodoferax sp.]